MARRKAMSPEARENQLIDLAYDLAEKQLAEGTASPMVVARLISAGSTKERLEREKLTRENEHLRAKIESLQSSQRTDELYDRAIRAFARYSGQAVDDED